MKQAEGVVYAVRIGQLASRADAQALAARLRAEHSATEPKVSM